MPATQDELYRLAATWNDMLARLELAVGRLSQFTADASHELRTPVALIRATAELALRKERPQEDYRKALGQVQAEAERTSQLVEDLLTLARADAGLPGLPLEPVDLDPLAREVCDRYRPLAAARGVNLVVDLTGEPARVEGNLPALRRLLLVLLDNAVKFTPTGGSITVSLARGAGVTLAVRDTGVGIAAEVLPHVFERFYRVDESRHRENGGAGLGLSIARTITDSHHAAFEVESRVNEGSRFAVRFPSLLAYH